MTRLEQLKANLATARLRVNDWHMCATQEELGEWRMAQQLLIMAARDYERECLSVQRQGKRSAYLIRRKAKRAGRTEA